MIVTVDTKDQDHIHWELKRIADWKMKLDELDERSRKLGLTEDEKRQYRWYEQWIEEKYAKIGKKLYDEAFKQALLGKQS